MSMKTDAQPAVWLGCLSCNNSGHLVGRWFPCDMIEEVTLAEVHGGQEYVYPGCEEVLALDSEYLPRGVSEISQPRAAAWGEIFVDAGGDRWEELLAWYENCSPSLDVNGVPSASEFEEVDQAAGTHSVSSWSPGSTTAACSTSGRRTLSGTSTGTSTSATAGRLHRCRCPLRRGLRLPQPVEEGCRCECGVECARPCRTVQMARG